MRVGLLKEIKSEENRVALTPGGVDQLHRRGHTVLVEQGAGSGSGFMDGDYRQAGAELATGAEEVYQKADLLLHVKEPQPGEYPLIRPGQTLFTYFHFAANEGLTRSMLERDAVCIAYETITDVDGSLPLLTPMSEVAGRMAAQEAAKYLERSQGGRGMLLGGVPGVQPATVLILGAGVVGTEAARMACGLGASVYLLDTCLERLRHLAEVMPKNCFPLMSNPETIRRLAREADVIIGAVLIHGAKAPKLIDRAILATLKPGTVLVDVAIDQGGCFETSRPTTHRDPTYLVGDILHYCVSNMPGAVPLTSTVALTNATLPYVIKLAQHGWKEAARLDAAIREGLNIVHGKVCFRGVAEAFDLPYTPVYKLLKESS